MKQSCAPSHDCRFVYCRPTTSKSPSPLKSVPDASADLEQLRQENAALRAALQQACLADMAPEVANEIQARLDKHFLVADSTETPGTLLRQKVLHHTLNNMTSIMAGQSAENVRTLLQDGGGLDALEDMELCESRDMRINGEVSSSGARPGQIIVRTRGGQPRSLQEARVERADESYFESYGYFDIHRTMISDKARSASDIAYHDSSCCIASSN